MATQGNTNISTKIPPVLVYPWVTQAHSQTPTPPQPRRTIETVVQVVTLPPLDRIYTALVPLPMTQRPIRLDHLPEASRFQQGDLLTHMACVTWTIGLMILHWTLRMERMCHGTRRDTSAKWKWITSEACWLNKKG